jgi:hypothetical protein
MREQRRLLLNVGDVVRFRYIVQRNRQRLVERYSDAT